MTLLTHLLSNEIVLLTVSNLLLLIYCMILSSRISRLKYTRFRIEPLGGSGSYVRTKPFSPRPVASVNPYDPYP